MAGGLSYHGELACFALKTAHLQARDGQLSLSFAEPPRVVYGYISLCWVCDGTLKVNLCTSLSARTILPFTECKTISMDSRTSNLLQR